MGSRDQIFGDCRSLQPIRHLLPVLSCYVEPSSPLPLPNLLPPADVAGTTVAQQRQAKKNGPSPLWGVPQLKRPLKSARRCLRCLPTHFGLVPCTFDWSQRTFDWSQRTFDWSQHTFDRSQRTFDRKQNRRIREGERAEAETEGARKASAVHCGSVGVATKRTGCAHFAAACPGLRPEV